MNAPEEYGEGGITWKFREKHVIRWPVLSCFHDLIIDVTNKSDV